MRARSVAILVAACSVAAVRTLAAQQPGPQPADSSNDPHRVQPERPTVATHAGTVAPGWLEIESGVERDRITSDATSISTPTAFKIGLASHAQLGIFGAVLRPPSGSTALGDVAIGVKWRLVDDAPIVGDFALLPSVKFPTGSSSSGTGTGTTDVTLLAISSHAFGDVAMDLNVGYTRRSGDGSAAPKTSSVWTVSFGGPFVGAFGWAAECYGYPATSGPAGQPSIVALLGGPTVLVRPWLALDAGVIVPVTGPQPRALYAGVVYNVGRLWGARR
jgi:hypothetical protein